MYLLFFELYIYCFMLLRIIGRRQYLHSVRQWFHFAWRRLRQDSKLSSSQLEMERKCLENYFLYRFCNVFQLGKS